LMDKKIELEKIAKKIASCQKCPLYKTATNPVPGNGDPNAEILLVGEAPGYWEDQKGIPFCGAAGKLLDELLASIGLSRDKVFVGNMLKHRPPENRDPEPSEMEACQEYLDEQINIINPKAVVTLGRFSMAKFLPYAKISKDHGVGRMVEFNGKKLIVIPMYHPAAALRAGAVDEQLRQNFLKIPAEIERVQKILDGVFDIKEEPIEEKKEEQLTLV